MTSAFGVEHISKATPFDTRKQPETIAAKKAIEDYHRSRLTGSSHITMPTKVKAVEVARKSGKFKALAIGGAAAAAAGAGGYAYAHRKKSA